VRIVRAFFQLKDTLSADDDVACVRKLRKLNVRKCAQVPRFSVYTPMQDADLNDVRAAERVGLSRWRAQFSGETAKIEAPVESFAISQAPILNWSADQSKNPTQAPAQTPVPSQLPVAGQTAMPAQTPAPAQTTQSWARTRISQGQPLASGYPINHAPMAPHTSNSGMPAQTYPGVIRVAVPSYNELANDYQIPIPPRSSFNQLPALDGPPGEIKVNLRSSRTKMPAFPPDHGLLAEPASARPQTPAHPPVQNCAPPLPDQESSSGDGQLSDSAKREVLRIQLMKRGHIARSLALANGEREHEDSEPETQLVQDWNCSGWNSLLLMREELLSKGNEPESNGGGNENGGDQQVGTSDTPESGTPPVLPDGKPNFNSRANPFRHYSDTALTLLAQNISTAPAALFWLSCHNNPDIRSAVARNPSCPPEALTYLAKDHEAGIRHAIAENPKASVGILEMLTADKNPLIAWRAQNSLNLSRARRTVTDLRLPNWENKPKDKTSVTQTSNNHLPFSDELSATEETVAFLKLIARKTNTPPRRLAELARHPDARIRAAVAENANTPLELLWLLAKDSEPEVKLKITENYNCPLDLLETLREDSDPYVAWQARSVVNRIVGNSQPQTSTDNNVTRPRSVISRDLI